MRNFIMSAAVAMALGGVGAAQAQDDINITLVPVWSHVNKINDQQATEVAKSALAGRFIGSLEIRG